MKKILLSLTLMLSFAGLLLFDACDFWDAFPSPPGWPELIYPADGEVINSQNVTLTWHPAYDTDTDHDDILYTVRLDDQPDFLLDGDSLTRLERFGITTCPVDSLKPNTYYWIVLADDGNSVASSEIWSFKIILPSDTLKLSSPENEAINVALDVRLEWEFISETNESGITFDVYIDTNDPPSAIVASNITELYFDPTVAPHTTYYWKVIGKGAEDDNIESEIWSFTTLSNAPESAVLESPANGAVGVALDKPLEWVAAADPDGDEVSYDVYLDTNNPPTTKVGTNNMGISFQPTLQTNTLYYWKVISKDGHGGLAESEIWSFSTLNTAPPMVILLNPANEAIDVSENVQLTWELNSETAGYMYKYDVYLDTNNPPTNAIGTDVLLHSLIAPLSSGTTYYWKVIANDDHEGVFESEIWSFTTTDPSLKVNLLLPANDAKDVPLNVQLKWELSADPGGVIYEYDVYLDTNDPPTTIAITHVTEPSFWPIVLPGTTYYWKVIGKDYFSGKTVESAKWKFKTAD